MDVILCIILFYLTAAIDDELVVMAYEESGKPMTPSDKGHR